MDERADLAPLRGAFVVLGVTGGIAAYKAIEVCRRLVDAGAHVAPVLTKGALSFVGAPTFNALSSQPVKVSLFEDADPIPHTTLGQRADLIVVAPATARIIGSYAAGISDDLLGATLLASRAPVLVCPAMHTEMWQHPAVQENLATLRRRGAHVLEPASGRLAGGDVGEGRLPDPERIVEEAARVLGARRDMAGVRVLVSAGGTREPIDPVRVIANRSSGKQGHAIAEVARARGAEVTLVTAAELPSSPGIARVDVGTARDMYEAMLAAQPEADLIVMAAAVADFRPVDPSSEKLKRARAIPEIVLERTEDILAALVAKRADGQVIVGFAAETENALANGRDKLERKDLDLIVINDVSQAGVGFGHDTNAVSILSRDGRQIDVAISAKSTIGAAVLDAALAQSSRH
jgi:phosphopantothenoylcysteine decarboxylase/phosphopantothenate--cysteine ligase